jgi:hypothetical protein
VRHLEKLIITNYDEDHASDLAKLVKAVSIGVLVSNPPVTAAQLRHFKKIGGIGSGIDALADMKSLYRLIMGERTGVLDNCFPKQV